MSHRAKHYCSAIAKRKIYLSQLFRCVALFHCSIHQAIRDNAPIVDVDGSYLYKKSKRFEESGRIVALLDSPSAPITGWEIVTEVNANTIAKKIPHVTTGTIYTYLSAHASQGSGDGTFRALTRGYTHWASGRIDRLEVNVQHPQYCHVQSSMKPSMKPGSYHVWILLERTGPFATIHSATCECAAGYVKISIDYILHA